MFVGVFGHHCVYLFRQDLSVFSFDGDDLVAGRFDSTGLVDVDVSGFAADDRFMCP